jgi:hypothetical protein
MFISTLVGKLVFFRTISSHISACEDEYTSPKLRFLMTKLIAVLLPFDLLHEDKGKATDVTPTAARIDTPINELIFFHNFPTFKLSIVQHVRYLYGLAHSLI